MSSKVRESAPPPIPTPIGTELMPAAVQGPSDDKGMTTLQQSFAVQHPRDDVWAFFGKIDRAARCMPGVSLDEPVEGQHVRGQMRVKLGPITAAFAGEGEIARDEADHRGIIEGSGRDARSASRAKGRVSYALREERDGGAG